MRAAFPASIYDAPAVLSDAGKSNHIGGSVAADPVTTLISIHKDQTTIVNALWTIYHVISLALLGYVVSQEYVRGNFWLIALLSLAFYGFSVGNRTAMVRSQKLIVASSRELNAMSQSDADQSLQKVLGAYEAITVEKLTQGHAAFTASVLATVWILFGVTIL